MPRDWGYSGMISFNFFSAAFSGYSWLRRGSKNAPRKAVHAFISLVLVEKKLGTRRSVYIQQSSVNQQYCRGRSSLKAEASIPRRWKIGTGISRIESEVKAER